MFKKLMKRLTNNFGLKLLSILFSIALWLVVVNIADPDGTKTFSVPVTIQNKDVIEKMGKVPDVVGDTDVASFYITGPRSYVEGMNADDFTVTADLSQVDLADEDEIKLVRIEVTAKKYEKYITIHQKTVNMQVTLDDYAEKNFVISPVTTGTPADGCAIGDVEVTPNLLTVSGPESVVSKINKVTATINVNGISSDVTDNVVPVLYDEEGNVISSDLLETNQSTVSIKANILGTKALPIHCDVTGEPADGYEYKGFEYAPQKVTVKGEAEILNTMSAITIPEEVIDITGATGNVENTIDITTYLPDGVSLVDDEVTQIAIKALIVSKETRVFNLPVANISVEGLPDSYELTYNSNVTTVPLTIRASQDDIDSFDIGSVQASIDASDLSPGAHTVQLALTINGEKYEIIGNVSVQINIRDKEADKTEEDNSNNTDNSNTDNSSNDQNSRNTSVGGR